MNSVAANSVAEAVVKLGESAADCPILWYKPRPKALPFHLDCEHRTRFAVGGKQSTKTYSSQAEIVMAMSGIESLFTPGALRKFRKPPLHGRIWCGDLKRVAEGVILPIIYKLMPRELLDASFGRNMPGYNRDRCTIYLTNGSWLQFMSYEMPAMKGESATLDFVVFDEPPKQSLYRSQYARIAARGGRMWAAMTLDQRRAQWDVSWVDSCIRRGKDGPHVAYYEFSTEDNFEAMAEEAETEEEAAEIRSGFADWKASLSKAEHDVCILGKGGWLAGLVYPEFDMQDHGSYDAAAPDELIDLARRGYGKIWRGLDHGLAHPTACVWWYVAHKPIASLRLAEGDFVQFREYKVAGRYVAQHVAAIKAMSSGMPVAGTFADPHLWDRDPRGGPTIAQMYIDADVPVFRGNNNKDVGWACIHNLLRVRGEPTPWPRLRLCKNFNPQTVDEVLGYSFRPDSERVMVAQRDRDIDKDDDLMDIWRYIATASVEKMQIVRPPPVECHPLTGFPRSAFTVHHARRKGPLGATRGFRRPPKHAARAI